MAKNSAVNLDITNNADGYDVSGGTTPRKLTVTGGNITLTGAGSNVYTFPSATSTLYGTATGSITSAQLATSLTDETGTGSAVFATSPTLVTPVLGTPTSVTLTNATGLPISGLVASTSTALGVGSIELGHATDTTITRTGAGAIAVEGVGVALNSISLAHTASTIELGHASDTTLSRASAGRLAVEGVNVVTTSSTDTLTGKTIDADGTGNVITNIGASEIKADIITGLTAETTIADDDVVMIYDTSATALRKMTKANFVSGLGGGGGATTLDGLTDTVITSAALGQALIYDGTQWENTEVPKWDIDTTSLNGVQRLRHSTGQFLANADFEAWNNGTNVAPPGWTSSGGVAIAQSAAISIGTYSAQLTFDASNTGVFYQAIPSNTNVDYTFTLYAQRTSGTGTASLVAIRDDSPFTEFASCAMPTHGSMALVALTVKPSAGTALRFAIKSTSASASTWKIDECMLQESKGIATTFQRLPIDDNTNQFVSGVKTFGGGSQTYSGGLKMYDTGSSNLITFVASGNPGSNSTVTFPATGGTVTLATRAPRVTSLTSSATPTFNVDTTDMLNITALATNITSMTSGMSGTPSDGQRLLVRIKGDATPRTIVWGTSFQSSGSATLLATTGANKTHSVGLIYDSVVAKFVCQAVDTTGY